MSISTAEIAEPEFAAEIQRLKDEGVCLREANVFINECHNKAIDKLLERLNRQTFRIVELEKENAMLLKDDEAIRCGIDSRTNCTGCPECRA